MEQLAIRIESQCSRHVSPGILAASPRLLPETPGISLHYPAESVDIRFAGQADCRMSDELHIERRPSNSLLESLSRLVQQGWKITTEKRDRA